jgi:hypothetical protein
MDAKTRGKIEQAVEDELEWKDNHFENVDNNYVSDIVPMSSKLDFLIGFVVGELTRIAWTYLPDATDYDLQEVREIIKRKLPEIRAQILKELNM